MHLECSWIHFQVALSVKGLLIWSNVLLTLIASFTSLAKKIAVWSSYNQNRFSKGDLRTIE